MKYENEIITDLYNKYQARYLKGSNFNKKVTIKIDNKNYNKYFSDPNLFDETLLYLEKLGYITLKYQKYEKTILSFSLNLDYLDEIIKKYAFLDTDVIKNKLFNELDKYNDKIIIDLKEVILKKKNIKYFLNDDFIDSLKAVSYIEGLKSNVFERNMSNYLYNDSKRLNKLKKYLNYIYKTKDIFKDKGIISSVEYLYLKGEGKVGFNGQIIDLKLIRSSVALELTELENLEFKDITKVTTIENLTTFHNYESDGLIIYLGGYSTKLQLDVLRKLKEQTNNFYHFGDIDYGGFMILANLIKNLNLNITPLMMDINTLEKHKEFLIKINDDKYINKLKSLLDNNDLKDSFNTIRYLIDNKVKLEQEAIYNK